MEVTVNVDARQALAKFSPAGIPEGVRRNLRRVIPDLTKRLGAVIERRLDEGLKSRTHLSVRKQMIENQKEIIGRVSVEWTGEKRARMVPAVLDTGAKPHPIVAKNAAALRFFWPRVGRVVMFKQVMHPGFPGIFYTRGALEEMGPEIQATIQRAAVEGARGA